MKKIFNLDNIRLRDKFLLLYITCVFIPIVLTNIIFYSVTTENVKQQRMNDISRALEQVKNEFRMEIDDAVSVSAIFYIDYNLNEMLEMDYKEPADYVAAYDSYLRRILNNYTPVYASMQNIRIYVDNPSILHSGGIGYLSDEIKQTVWYQKLQTSSSSNPIFVRTYKENRMAWEEPVRDTFSIVRRMDNFENNSWEKILKIELRMPIIDQVFRNMNLSGYVYLINESGLIEYTTDPAINWASDQVYYEDLNLPDKMIEFRTDYTAASYLDGWTLIGTISEEEVFSEVHKSREFVIWMAVINLLICTLIILWISKSMHTRLIKILRYMKKVKNQKFDIIEEGATKDEIGQLLGEFNRMTLQIKSLIDDVYIADIQRKALEIERRKAQFNALQSQINPHFLFNSLETIRMRSLMKKEDETAGIIHNMAKLLRSSLTWKKDKVTVKEELEFILCFLEIQKYRFGDRLRYDIHVDQEAKRVMIPKMVFLPFVENASIHGIEALKHGGHIDIVFRIKGNDLEFQIRDNGVGMSAGQVEKLYSYINGQEEIGERIGVQNVIYRMKMVYGEKFDLYIDSAPQKGTFIRIKIPVNFDLKHLDI